MRETKKEALIEKLEKTKFWVGILHGVSRFDSEEKKFFLENIQREYCKKNKTAVNYYAELINAIARHYDPSGEAKRVRLVLLIKSL
ncbi:hypothetical protein C4565_06730 [Candidatus Parcubacteria bacterium]|jgi:hypothetical protein|nr:MAG: hypothetical protein C4565_06730 [Candidatus Parcubacteria bacterium]